MVDLGARRVVDDDGAVGTGLSACRVDPGGEGDEVVADDTTQESEPVAWSMRPMPIARSVLMKVLFSTTLFWA